MQAFVSSPGFRDRLRSLRVDLALFCLLFSFAPYAASNFMNYNAVSRLGLAHAIAARGELTIDEVARATADKAQHAGHFYCDKAPGLSLLCVPAVALADWTADRLGFGRGLLSVQTGKGTKRYKLCAYACLLASSAWIYALSVVLFRRALLAAGVAQRGATLITLFFAFGTPPLMWSTTLFGHACAAGLLFSAFALYWLIRAASSTSTRGKRWLWNASGGLLGLAVVVEFTALPAAAVLAAFLVLSERDAPALLPPWRRAVALGLGGVGPAAVLFVYNALAFGHPLRVGYSNVQGFAGMQSGFFGVAVPSAEIAFTILFSEYKGLFALSPILLIALVACVRTLREPVPERDVGLLALAITGYYVALNAGYYYWDGGWSTGPRHITPVAPFLMFGLGIAYKRVIKRPFQAIVVSAGALSMLVVTTCALVRVTAPNDGAPVFRTHVLPRLLEGRANLLPRHLGLSSRQSYLLALLVIAAASWALLRAQKSERPATHTALPD